MGPRAVLAAVVKRKSPAPRRESNPRTTIAQRYTDWAITALGVHRVVSEVGRQLKIFRYASSFPNNKQLKVKARRETEGAQGEQEYLDVR
jgi:hypothetical protein